jgi:hypothetical protein
MPCLRTYIMGCLLITLTISVRMRAWEIGVLGNQICCATGPLGCCVVCLPDPSVVYYDRSGAIEKRALCTHH